MWFDSRPSQIFLDRPRTLKLAGMQLFLQTSIGQQLVWIVCGLFLGVLPLIFVWRSFKRAGLPKQLTLLVLIPGGFIIALGVLAYADWPALRGAALRVDRLA